MKINIIAIIALLSMVSCGRIHKHETMDTKAPPVSWATLGKQAKDMANAIRDRNVHPIHKIDHAIASEVVALQKGAPAFPADQKAKLDGLLQDMAKQAHRAHIDGHAAKWDDAAAAQKQFAADLKQTEAIFSSGK